MEPVSPIIRPSRKPGSRLAAMLLVTLFVGGSATAGLLIATRDIVDSLPRVPGVAEVLSPANPDVENFLLVGSDSRAEGDPNTGEVGDVTNSRSDTIMVLRADKTTGTAALLSIPRDLYVERADGTSGRINGAYNDGPGALTQTVQSALGIPVHHYIEVDFVGFKDLVDALGGVEMCFMFPTRDLNTGLNIEQPGCHVLEGVEALAFARSRKYEEFREGEWRREPTADIGRTARQRTFVDRALHKALDRVSADPLAVGELTTALGSALGIDEELDPVGAAGTLRAAIGAGLSTYELPVFGDDVDGASVLRLADGADAVLDYFGGRSNLPPPKS